MLFEILILVTIFLIGYNFGMRQTMARIRDLALGNPRALAKWIKKISQPVQLRDESEQDDSTKILVDVVVEQHKNQFYLWTSDSPTSFIAQGNSVEVALEKAHTYYPDFTFTVVSNSDHQKY